MKRFSILTRRMVGCLFAAIVLPVATRAHETKDRVMVRELADLSVKFSTQTVNASREKIVSGGVGCPVIMAGSKVFSTDTLEHISTLSYGPIIGQRAALSNDGRYFAVSRRSVDSDGIAARVFDVGTGRQVCTIPGTEMDSIDNILFTRNVYVVIAGRSSPKVSVWKASTGELVKEFPVDENSRLSTGKIAVTRDGKHLCVVEDKRISVIDVAQTKVVAVMQPPNSRPGGLYASLTDLRFSPAGTRLAGVSYHGSVMTACCWDGKTKLQLSSPIAAPASFDTNLRWFPEGDAWLVSGQVIDSATGQRLMSFSPYESDELFVHDQNTVIGRFVSNPTLLGRVTIPWQALGTAKQAITDKADAFIRPGQGVDIRFQPTGRAQPGGNEEQRFTYGMKKLFAACGIQHTPGAPNYFRVTLDESTDGKAKFFNLKDRATSSSVPRGVEATQVLGALQVELMVQGQADPIWSHTVVPRQQRAMNMAVNDANVRTQMLMGIDRQLSFLRLPTFIARNKATVILPLIAP